MTLTELLENRASEVGWTWNPLARLRCIGCGGEQPLGAAFNGCSRCSEDLEHAPLEVIYEESDPLRGSDPRSVSQLLSCDRQPIAPAKRISLGRSPTPLVPAPTLGPMVLIKNETLSPTWGHKDRLHELNAGVAKLLGSKGIVASTTGNHGAAAAAHAAAAKLPAVIFCHPEASPATLQMISAYGGTVVQVNPEEQQAAVRSMVDEGWYPATSMDPITSGRSNPYGAEGYKSIAYEIAADLRQLPEAVIIPTASGDTVYGVAKGFAEIAAAIGSPPTRIIATQPEAANPLQRSILANQIVHMPNARSFALSVSDSVTGRQAIAALQRWGGNVVSVPETEIQDSVRAFARIGLLIEPASALSLAGYQQALEESLIGSEDVVVLLATAAGIKWPRELAEIFPVSPIRNFGALESLLSSNYRKH